MFEEAASMLVQDREGGISEEERGGAREKMTQEGIGLETI